MSYIVVAARRHGRYSFWSSIATSIDMGLYAATISPEAMHEPTVLAFYFPYMIVVQAFATHSNCFRYPSRAEF